MAFPGGRGLWPFVAVFQARWEGPWERQGAWFGWGLSGRGFVMGVFICFWVQVGGAMEGRGHGVGVALVVGYLRRWMIGSRGSRRSL